jgi:hypothetical protein
VGFVVDKVALRLAFSKYLDFSANLHLTDRSKLIIYHLGLVQ